MNNNIIQLFMMVIPVFLCLVAPYDDASIRQEKDCSDISLAGFFPRSSPFSHSQTENRLSAKKLSNKIKSINQDNFLIFEKKVKPIVVLIHVLEDKNKPHQTHQKLLAYWQLGEFIAREKQLYSDNTLYHAYLMTALADKLNVSRDHLAAIEKLYQTYQVAATLSYELTWGHYLILIEIEDDGERSFYQRLAVEKKWAPAELKNAVDSDLFHQPSQLGNTVVTVPGMA